MTRDVSDVTHRKNGLRFKKSVSWVLPREKTVDFRLLAVALCWVRTVVWGRWKSQVYLPPYVEKPFNSKVIKNFRTWTKKSWVFFVFRDSYVLCIYVMNILCTFHISVSWVCYSSKLAETEYKTRHDWVGKLIHWEMCKKFKFDHTNKWYMHKPAPVLENDTHKLQWDFDI